MLRITASKSVDAAMHYFDHALTKGDYYLEGQEICRKFGGELSKQLDIEGEVTKEVSTSS